MKTIKDEVKDITIINKSKFITYIIPTNDINEVKEKLENFKDKYKDATHECFGYIIDFKEKCSDDGEPSGTAGLPILNVLKNNNLTNVVCIVIRYFGGIKLGSGGLIRAYSSCVKNALEKCEFGILEKGYKIVIEFDYNNIKNIDYILKKYNPIKSFNNKISYTFNITENDFNILKNSLEKYSIIKNKEKITIIKDD